ncbi:hypothetical protein RFI_29830 [Reticulomyxa filosa]|uniref:Uncharacterized protein n=1 Tax=Reticulomyxa filosa TaxID=46433 RepID=X6M2B9_RETFI|nr:hypothetical protein RFI_29830 [Reticulomyxa filosa]|eukprot:ETO07562.1 hypothetical protein RFI_29830 [Reticulomyxa filosa]
MFDKANKRRQSVEIKSQDRGSLKRSRPQDDENELEKSNKKEINLEMKIAGTKEKELNDENIWKENKKVRKDYFCKTSPSLVFTPVNGRGLISQTSILKFIGINEKRFVKKLKAHTFSQSWKTLFVHFRKQQSSKENGNDEKQDQEGMPVVKVIFGKAEDAIDEKIITIGFNEAKCEIFDKNNSKFQKCVKDITQVIVLLFKEQGMQSALIYLDVKRR